MKTGFKACKIKDVTIASFRKYLIYLKQAPIYETLSPADFA
jgi:hypothetical protein